jgi:hypothetical protein
VPVPPGGLESYLMAVSCTSPTACTAVGAHMTSGPETSALAERWDGTRWAVQPTPPEPGSELLAVSCTSARACVAAGHSTNILRQDVPLVERWDGTRWTARAAPLPRPVLSGGFTGVSCRPAAPCTAVGSGTTAAGAYRTLAEREHGRGWLIQRMPLPRNGRGSGPAWVACASAAVCTLAGDQNDRQGVPRATLAARWAGARWVIERTPAAAHGRFAGFTGVACPSPADCVAVGAYFARGGITRALIEQRH